MWACIFVPNDPSFIDMKDKKIPEKNINVTAVIMLVIILIIMNIAKISCDFMVNPQVLLWVHRKKLLT